MKATEGDVIQAMRALIPPWSGPCPAGCVKCCNFPEFSSWERGRLSTAEWNIGWAAVQRGEVLCPFKGEGCLIYTERPISCRLFGTIPEYPCSKGLSMNCRQFPARVGRTIADIYARLTGEHGPVDYDYELLRLSELRKGMRNGEQLNG
jgi:hypothetical protein